MIVFWMLTALMAAMAGLLVLGGARRGAGAPSVLLDARTAAAEMAELDRLKARGLLDEAGWTAARAEAGRRILNAERHDAPVVAGAKDRLWVLAGLAATIAGALSLYLTVGQAGLADQPYQGRVDDWAGHLDTLEAPQLAAVAARVVRDHPTDHDALTMLGAARFEAGDPLGAASAFRRALKIQPDDAQSWARLGESLVRSNTGKVGADAEAAFGQALKHDPNQLGARYFLGEAALARRDLATARMMWLPLIAALDPRDPRRIDLERRLPAARASQ